jgi:hypothetical protein
MIGGSYGSSSSSSSSSSGSRSVDSVFQSDVFQQLFGGAASTAAGINTGGLTETANQLFGSGTSFLSELEAMATGTDASGQYLQGRVSGANPLLDQNIQGLQTDLGRFFNEQLLPGITNEAIVGGGLGSSRQGIAQVGAVREVADQFSRGSTALRTADLAARDQAAAQLSGQRLQGAQAGLGGLNQQYGLMEAGAMAGLSPFAALAQILGDPTILTSASSESESKSKSKSMSAGLGF